MCVNRDLIVHDNPSLIMVSVVMWVHCGAQCEGTAYHRHNEECHVSGQLQ